MSAPIGKALRIVSRSRGGAAVRRSSAVSCDTWKVDAIGGLAAALLAIVAYLLCAGPLLERHGKVLSQRADLLAAHEKSIDLNRKLEDLKARLALVQRDLAAAPLKLQPSTLLNQRLALLTDLVTQSGASVDDIQPGKVVSGARFDTLTLKLSGTASYCAFAALLHRLREGFPDIGVAAIDVAGDPQDADGSAKFTVDLIWYTQATKPAPLAPAEKPLAGADK